MKIKLVLFIGFALFVGLVLILPMLTFAPGPVEVGPRAGALYALPATHTPTHTPTHAATPTPAACLVATGLQAGALNLRACGGPSCAIVGNAHEGERLTIITPGAWALVETATGARGWVNSVYCGEVGE